MLHHVLPCSGKIRSQSHYNTTKLVFISDVLAKVFRHGCTLIKNLLTYFQGVVHTIWGQGQLPIYNGYNKAKHYREGHPFACL